MAIFWMLNFGLSRPSHGTTIKRHRTLTATWYQYAICYGQDQIQKSGLPYKMLCLTEVVWDISCLTICSTQGLSISSKSAWLLSERPNDKKQQTNKHTHATIGAQWNIFYLSTQFRVKYDKNYIIQKIMESQTFLRDHRIYCLDCSEMKKASLSLLFEEEGKY